MSSSPHASPPADAAVAIRAATRADCAAMREIYNHYVFNETCTWALEPETLEDRLAWFDRHDADHPVFVAEAESDDGHGGRIVGWASLSVYNLRGGYRRTVENSIYLDHTWRRRGVGSALLVRLIEAAKERGHHTIIAGISTEQAGSVALHAKHGFVEVG